MSKSNNNAIPSNCHHDLLNAFQPTQQCLASPERSPPKRPRRSPGSSQTGQFHARLGMWVSQIIALHCMTRETQYDIIDSIIRNIIGYIDNDIIEFCCYHVATQITACLHGQGVWEIAPNTALSLSPSLTVFGFALGEETHRHIDRKSDRGQGLKKPSHVQVLIYADFWAYWNSSTVSQLATNLWTW